MIVLKQQQWVRATRRGSGPLHGPTMLRRRRRLGPPTAVHPLLLPVLLAFVTEATRRRRRFLAGGVVAGRGVSPTLRPRGTAGSPRRTPGAWPRHVGAKLSVKRDPRGAPREFSGSLACLRRHRRVLHLREDPTPPVGKDLSMTFPLSLSSNYLSRRRAYFNIQYAL